MANKKEIEEEVRRTMHALDGLEKAETDPYFFSRLEQRIQKRSASPVPLWKNLWAEPRYLLASLAIVLLVGFNIFSMAQFDQLVDTEAEYEEEIATTFAEEYVIDIPILYNE